MAQLGFMHFCSPSSLGLSERNSILFLIKHFLLLVTLSPGEEEPQTDIEPTNQNIRALRDKCWTAQRGQKEIMDHIIDLSLRTSDE